MKNLTLICLWLALMMSLASARSWRFGRRPGGRSSGEDDRHGGRGGRGHRGGKHGFGEACLIEWETEQGVSQNISRPCRENATCSLSGPNGGYIGRDGDRLTFCNDLVQGEPCMTVYANGTEEYSPCPDLRPPRNDSSEETSEETSEESSEESNEEPRRDRQCKLVVDNGDDTQTGYCLEPADPEAFFSKPDCDKDDNDREGRRPRGRGRPGVRRGPEDRPEDSPEDRPERGEGRRGGRRGGGRGSRRG